MAALTVAGLNATAANPNVKIVWRPLVAAKLSDARVVEELFLATLSRSPNEDEKRAALDRVSAAPDREAGLTDVLWALINTREFILNH